MNKKANNYAFIDSQNLHLSIKRQGWKLNFKKFRQYLADQYQIKKAYLFIGYIVGNENLYASLQNMGYIAIHKPTLPGEGTIIKGNCDSELVLHCMIQYKKFDKAIIISGDGDFHCLIEYLLKKRKLLKIGIPNKIRYSALLRKFRHYFFYIGDLKQKLKHAKTAESG